MRSVNLVEVAGVIGAEKVSSVVKRLDSERLARMSYQPDAEIPSGVVATEVRYLDNKGARKKLILLGESR